MTEALRESKKKWDQDGDGKIDLEEYTAYYLSRVAEVKATKAAESPTPGKPGGTGAAIPSDPFENERPDVLRFGKLPKGLPAWFMDWDLDQDAQIGLYEWRKAGQPLEEFLKLDVNEDGFISVEECMAAVKKAGPMPQPQQIKKKE